MISNVAYLRENVIYMHIKASLLTSDFLRVLSHAFRLPLLVGSGVVGADFGFMHTDVFGTRPLQSILDKHIINLF